MIGTAKVNLSIIPNELKARKQWVLWRLEVSKGKKRKVPVTPQGNASVADASTWMSFEEASHHLESNASGYEGIGYVFAGEDPYCGIDLDNCVVAGQLTEEAKEILLHLQSYTERSPSKSGVHVIVKAVVPGTRNRIKQVEIYDSMRFFTFTGDHVAGTPRGIEFRQEAVNALYDRLFTAATPTQRQAEVNSSLLDQDIISKAVKAANGAKFGELYAGSWNVHFQSQSEADQALVNMLAFYTRSPEQLDRLFRGSGLMRGKWEREDYSRRTIERALQTVGKQFGAREAPPLPEPPPERPQRPVQPPVPMASSEQHIVEDEEIDWLIDAPVEWEGQLRPEALYGLAGDVVRLIEPHTEADPAALLMNFLTIFANVVGPEPHFIVSGGVHRMKIFSVLVGATFRGKKGTSLEPIVKLFRAVDPDFMKRKASGLSSGEGVIYAVRDPVTERVPVIEGEGKNRRKTGEFEEVVVDPGIEDKRLLVIESEFGAVLNVLKRDGNTLSAIIRNAWDGDGDIRTLTKNPLTASNTHIGITGHITPEELRKLLNGTDIHNGFVNRFLWVYVQQSKSLPSGGNFHKVDVSGIVERIRLAAEYGQAGLPKGKDGRVLPMERDTEADVLWEKIYEPLQKDCTGVIGAATSRVIPYVMRLSCLYALLDLSPVIRVKHLRAAIGVWAYCFRSVRFIFGEQYTEDDPVVSRILGELKARNEGMSATEISALFGRNLPKEELKGAIKRMQDAGIVVVRSVSSGAGRPKQIIELNQSDDLN